MYIFLQNVKCKYFSQAALVELLVEFTFVAAVGGVGLEDVAVAGFQLFQHSGFVYRSGAAVVG